MISKSLFAGIVLALLTMLSGCGTSGYYRASAADEDAIRNGAFVPDAVAQIAIVQHPDYNGGIISPQAMQKIQELSISCQRQVGPQLAGKAQAVATGVFNGAVPGVGEGPAARAADFAVTDARIWNYSAYGAVANTFFGAFNGAANGSYAMVVAIGGCTRDFWQLSVKKYPVLEGTFVELAYTKTWGDARPPALNKEAVVAPPPAK